MEKTLNAPDDAWLTVTQAAVRAKVKEPLIYEQVRLKRLRAARIGGRRNLRFRAAWVDEWLERDARPVEL